MEMSNQRLGSLSAKGLCAVTNDMLDCRGLSQSACDKPCKWRIDHCVYDELSVAQSLLKSNDLYGSKYYTKGKVCKEQAQCVDECMPDHGAFGPSDCGPAIDWMATEFKHFDPTHVYGNLLELEATCKGKTLAVCENTTNCSATSSGCTISDEGHRAVMNASSLAGLLVEIDACEAIQEPGNCIGNCIFTYRCEIRPVLEMTRMLDLPSDVDSAELTCLSITVKADCVASSNCLWDSWGSSCKLNEKILWDTVCLPQLAPTPSPTASPTAAGAPTPPPVATTMDMALEMPPADFDPVTFAEAIAAETDALDVVIESVTFEVELEFQFDADVTVTDCETAIAVANNVSVSDVTCTIGATSGSRLRRLPSRRISGRALAGSTDVKAVIALQDSAEAAVVQSFNEDAGTATAALAVQLTQVTGTNVTVVQTKQPKAKVNVKTKVITSSVVAASIQDSSQAFAIKIGSTVGGIVEMGEISAVETPGNHVNHTNTTITTFVQTESSKASQTQRRLADCLLIVCIVALLSSAANL